MLAMCDSPHARSFFCRIWLSWPALSPWDSSPWSYFTGCQFSWCFCPRPLLKQVCLLLPIHLREVEKGGKEDQKHKEDRQPVKLHILILKGFKYVKGSCVCPQTSLFVRYIDTIAISPMKSWSYLSLKTPLPAFELQLLIFLDSLSCSSTTWWNIKSPLATNPRVGPKWGTKGRLKELGVIYSNLSFLAYY